MIRVTGDHQEKHTLSGLGEIFNHTWYHSHISDASCLLGGEERLEGLVDHSDDSTVMMPYFVPVMNECCFFM